MAKNDATVIVDGNTLVSGTNKVDKIQIGAPNVDSVIPGVTIQADAGNDSINNYKGSNTLIEAGEGNDIIILNDYSSGSTVRTGAGNDTVTIWSTDTTTLDLGTGGNVIHVVPTLKSSVDLNISVGANASMTYSYANGASVGKTTITGAGGSTLRGSKGTDLFVAGSGSNVVVGYGGEDQISIASGYTTEVSGDDVVLKSGSNTMTIKNVKAHTININGSSTKIGSYVSKSPQEFIEAFMGALDKTTKKGSAALDEAVLALNTKYATMDEVIAAAVADCKTAGNADVFLRDYCGIILDNADTGAITGWDAGGANVKTAEGIVPESGSTFSTASNTSFTVDGLTLTLPEITGAQASIAGGLKDWWTKSSLDLIKSSYGMTFQEDDTYVKTMDVVMKTDSKKALAWVENTSSGSNSDQMSATKLSLTINTRYYPSVTDENGKTTVDGGGYLDRTLAHEFTHAVMAANIMNFNALPAYIKEGMAELTHGIDDERATLISSLGGSNSKLKSALGTSTVTGNDVNYAGGYILLRYLAHQAANTALSNGIRENTKKTSVIVSSVDDSLSAVDAGMYSSTVVTIDASAASKALNITGNAKDNIMVASANYKSTMNGGAGKDKLYGSAGSDTFIFEVGNGSDVIGNTAKNQNQMLYQEQDKIVIVGDADSVTADGFLSFKDSKSQVVVSFGGSSEKLTINKEDTLTPVTFELKSALSGNAVKTITYGDVPQGVTLDSKFTTASITADATSAKPIDVGAINSQIKIVNGNAATVPVSIIGNSQATAISLGGSGGTVTGGYDYTKKKGLDDKFYGNSGSDVFVYSLGGGKDQIFNYNGDADAIVLQGFTDLDTITTNTANAVSYKDNGNAVVLTMKSGGSLTINKPEGQVKVYKDSVSDSNSLLAYGVELPNYTAFNSNKTAVTLSGGGDSTEQINIDLIGDGYPANVKEVDASAYVATASIVGNEKADVLRASKGGSTLDGGSGEKATGDKLYGNKGADTFVYKILPDSVGGGTDLIGGDSKKPEGNYETQDKIIITSGTGLTATDITFKDAKLTTTLTFNGNKKDKLTINKMASDTMITLNLGADGATTFTEIKYGELKDGVTYGKKNGNVDYTVLSVGGAAANSTIDAAAINSQIKNFDLTAATNAVYVVGNAVANNITVGAAGGTLDGGAGNDKLIGNSSSTAATTFIYTLGEGKDEISGYNGNHDKIIVRGYTAAINTADAKVFKDNGKDITLNLTSGTTKGTLVIKNPNGKLTIVGEEEDGSNSGNILTYGANLPDPTNMTYNASKTVLTIGSDAALGTTTKLALRDYGITLKELDASAYSTSGLYLVGSDGKANVLRAGDNKFTLQGGSGADKLYGGDGTDTFVYSIGGGKDEIYSLDGAQSDEILIIGYDKNAISSSDTKVFKDTGKDITLTLGNSKLTLKNPVGQLNVYSATYNEETSSVTKGAALLNYDSNLASGISYNATKTVLTVDSSVTTATAITASVENSYSNMLKTIDASSAVVNVELTGNKNANLIYGGTKASTLNGGDGNDQLYGKTGGTDTFVYDHTTGSAGKDIINNYNASEGDVIKLSATQETGGMKLTYNGKTLVFNYTDKIDNKSVTGTLTVNGKSSGTKYANIDTATTVAIQIGTGAVKYYQFLNTKLKNLTLDSAVANGDAKEVASASAGSSTSAELPGVTEDYWFTQDAVGVETTDELGEILDIQPLATEYEELDEISKKARELDKAFVSTDLNRHRNRRG